MQQVSYVVNTSTDTFSRGQDHSGSVQVSPCGKAAVRAPEGLFGESQACLSLAAPRTRHRRVGGRHQHHRSARPLATFNQLRLGRTDRSISALAGHRGPGQELRFEVLDSDDLVVVDDTLRPDPPRVLVLVRGLAVQLRRSPLGPLVPVRRSLAPGVTTGHLPLGSSELGRTPPPMSEVGQIVSRIGSCGRAPHPPVDTNRPSKLRNGLGVAADHERRIPVPKRILIDTDTARLGWKITGPHHRDAHAPGQPQPATADSETPSGVLQRWVRFLMGCELRPTPILDLERLGQCEAVSPQDLLLSNLRPFTQPNDPASGLGKQLAQSGEVWALPGLLHVDGFVPEEPASVPLREQRALRLHARAQTVRVAHCLNHTRNVSAGTDIPLPVVRHRFGQWRPYLPTAKAGGFTGATR